MLKVIIMHTKDSVYVQEVANGDQVLSTFSEEDGRTDLSVCHNYVQQDIEIEHHYENGDIKTQQAFLNEITETPDGGEMLRYEYNL